MGIMENSINSPIIDKWEQLLLVNFYLCSVHLQHQESQQQIHCKKLLKYVTIQCPMNMKFVLLYL